MSDEPAPGEAGSEESDAPEEAPSPPPPPYLYAPDAVPDAATFLDELASDAEDLFHLTGAVDSPEGSQRVPDDGLRSELWTFLTYKVTPARGGRGPAGARIVPLEGGETYMPVRAIRSAPDDVQLLWEDLATQVSAEPMQARAHDLCFSARIGKVGDHGQLAVEAYLASRTSSLSALNIAAGLSRSWTIGREMKNPQLEERALAEIVDYLAEHLEGAIPMPGVALPLLDALTTRPMRKTAPPPRDTIAALLDRAHQVFTDDYLQTRIAGMMRRIAATDEERQAADRLEVKAHLDQAEASDNALARMIHLQQAATTARDLHVPDLHQQAVSALQLIDPDDLGLQEISVGSELPAYVVEAELSIFDSGHDWRQALHNFLSTECPSGSYETNLADAADTLKWSLASIFQSFRIGQHGMPQQSTSTDGEQLDAQVVNYETMHADNRGRWYAMGLQRMIDAYGIPDLDELTAFLIDFYGADPAAARVYASALRLYWGEEHFAAMQVAIPLVEAGARSLLLLLNEPIYRVEKGAEIGQYPGLGALLPRLTDEGFDKDWERFIRMLLLPPGYNLRNLAAHGFVSGISPPLAALVLRAAGLMVRLSVGPGATENADAVREQLARPAGTRANYPVRVRIKRVWRAVRRSLGSLRRR